MNSCDTPGVTAVATESARVTDKGSRLHRFAPAASPDGPHTWQGVAVEEYKGAAAHHCGVVRMVLAGGGADQTRFEVRYFEIQPAGFSSREHHRHEHTVIVLRGRGEVWLGGTWHEVGFGDTVYVAPHEVHQLRNTAGEPFGFLCIVDRQRDLPTPVTPP